jgi:hypothetical protein
LIEICGQCHSPASSLLEGKKYSYAPTKLNRIPGGSQSQFGHFGKEKNLALLGIKPLFLG